MQITIKSYTFHLSAPYSAGTVITAGEAQALNNLRAENIQNNLRRFVNEAVDRLQERELLAPEVLAELQARFDKYDREYQFLERGTSRPRLGDLESEALLVARERIEAAFRRDGDPLPADDLLEAMVAKQAGLPAVKEEARLRVIARRQVTAGGLESLV